MSTTQSCSMSNKIFFTIYGKAIAQKRARTTEGMRGVYNPSKKDMLSLAREIEREAFKEDFQMIENEPVEIRIKWHVLRPGSKTLPKKKFSALKILHWLFPTTKPDIDNLIKMLFDAANGILWHDDKQVVRVIAEKVYTDQIPRTEVEVKAVQCSIQYLGSSLPCAVWLKDYDERISWLNIFSVPEITDRKFG